MARNFGLLALGVGGTFLYTSGFGNILLRADGHVARERVAVASAFEGRVAEVFVRPGDHVEKGQRIAVVKSVAISRTLSDLEAERARLTSKIAQLEARQKVVLDTLPLAKSSAERTASFLQDIDRAQASGLAVRKSLQEMTSASLSAAEHAAGLAAEQGSLSVELDADRAALNRVISAYDDLSTTYADGALYATVSGDVGATVAPVGQAVSTANGAVADIFTGKSFVLAYLPDSYLLELSEGQNVGVLARNESLNARIERILPLAQNLPSDLQQPNRELARGRLVRIALPEANELPVDQRVRVTRCLMSDCRIGLANGIFQKARAAFSGLYKAAMAIGTESKSSVERLASARRSDGTL